MDIQNQLEILSLINRLDSTSTSYDRFLSLYHDFTKSLHTEIMTTKAHEIYFRTRIHNSEKIRHISELGPPPSDNVLGFQRCNAPKSPAFYLSSRRFISVLETNPAPGDIIYISQWIGKNKLPVNVMLEPKNHRMVKPDENILQALFYSHSDTIFTAKIHREFSVEYKRSAAITEVMTRNYQEERELCVKSDGLVGLRYPSMFNKLNSYNTVYPATFAFTRLVPIHLIQAEILSLDEGRPRLKIHDTAYDFAGGGFGGLETPLKFPSLMREKVCSSEATERNS